MMAIVPLTTLKVGDKAYFTERYTTSAPVIVEVTKVTKTQITVGSGHNARRFMIDSSREVGSSSRYPCRLYVLTPEAEAGIVEQVERNALVVKASRLIDSVSDTRVNSWDTDRIRAFIAALSPIVESAKKEA